MAGRSAIVVGGGIGGLAAAGALAKDGWRVTLFEQAPEFGPVGAGVSLAPTQCAPWTGSDWADSCAHAGC